MTSFGKMTTIKAATTPAIGAAVTSIILGRYTTTRTSTHVTNTLTNKAMLQSRTYASQMVTKSPIAQNLVNTRQLQSLSTKKQCSTSTAPSTPKQGGGANSTNTNPRSENIDSSKQNVSFLQWYENHLESRPVATKMVTGSILWGLGDFVAQVVPKLFFDQEEERGKVDGSGSTSSSKKDIVYDYPRTARAMFFGFGIHAPLSHMHFNFLEWMTIKGGFTGLSIPVFKAFMEQFVYWSWFSNSLYHGAMGAMQGMSYTQIYDRIADVLWETQKAQWVFWIPVQLLNFRFVPVRHQLNVVLLTSVVWTALLSAWYPPEEENDDSIEKEKEEKRKK